VIKKILVFLLLLSPIAKANELPETPQPKKEAMTISRRVFLAGTTLLAASVVADAVSTRIVLNSGGWENNPEFGKHPSIARQAGVNAAIFAGEVAVLSYTERNRRWYVRWGGRAYIGFSIANHLELSACNFKAEPSKPCRPLLPF